MHQLTSPRVALDCLSLPAQQEHCSALSTLLSPDLNMGYSCCCLLLLVLSAVTSVTRFQSQLPDQKHYTRVFPALATIWREEGPRALYKGFVPKALRLGIGQSVGLVTFQQLLKAFGVDAPKDPTEPEYIPVPWE